MCIRDRPGLGCELGQFTFPQPQPVTVGTSAVGGDQQPVGFGVGGGADLVPPAADRLDRERASVVVGSHRHPAGVGGHVVHPVRRDLAEFPFKVIDIRRHWLTGRPVLPAAVTEVADKLLLFAVDADHRLPRGYMFFGLGWGVLLPSDSDPRRENFSRGGRVIMLKYRKFTQEYRDEAVLMVIQSQRPIAQVARELGINEGTLGTWLSKYRSEHPVTEELSLPDRAKLKELEREVRELRLMNDFLKKAAAYFAREQ